MLPPIIENVWNEKRYQVIDVLIARFGSFLPLIVEGGCS
ncbi:MAG: hypothetical protein ACI9HA_002859 [Dinoroseobacter sp.]|jgi:hypothetical protein